MLDPEAVVALGATAAKALLGSSFRVTRERGRLLESDWPRSCRQPIHPSAILRARDDESR